VMSSAGTLRVAELTGEVENPLRGRLFNEVSPRTTRPPSSPRACAIPATGGRSSRA
jgi:hypothetical protein